MRSTVRLLLLGAVALAAGCGSSDDNATTGAVAASTAAPAATTAAAAATTAAPTPPAGLAPTYTRDLTAEDIARTASFRTGGANQVTPPPGALTLKLQADQISVTDETGFEVAEVAKLTSDSSLEIVSYVDPSKASFCGPDAPQNASYTWKTSGTDLTLAPVEDRCADRNSMLAGTWTQAP